MTEKNSGPQEGVKGVVEDVKGKAKEAVGTVTGRDDMVREGKAQRRRCRSSVRCSGGSLAGPLTVAPGCGLSARIPC